MKKKNSTEGIPAPKTDLPFVKAFRAGKEKVTRGTQVAELEVIDFPTTVEELDEYTPRQKAGLVVLAMRQINQHNGSDAVKAALKKKEIKSGDKLTVSFPDMIDLADSEATSKAAKAEAETARIKALGKALATAYAEGNQEEIDRLQAELLG